VVEAAEDGVEAAAEEEAEDSRRCTETADGMGETKSLLAQTWTHSAKAFLGFRQRKLLFCLMKVGHASTDAVVRCEVAARHAKWAWLLASPLHLAPDSGNYLDSSGERPVSEDDSGHGRQACSHASMVGMHPTRACRC